MANRITVHKNLNLGLWSLTRAKGRNMTLRGLLLRHAESCVLANVQFIVQASGRDRVIRNRCREVHAWCVGELVDSVPHGLAPCPVTYNPYRSGTFTTRDGTPVTHARFVEFTESDGAVAYGVTL